MRVHGHDGREVCHAEPPHRFGYSEFEQLDVEHFVNAFGVILGCAADGVKVDRAVLFHRGQRLRAHSAFADDGAHAVAFDDLALVRLFADAGGGAGGGDPVIAIFHDDGAAMV